MPNPGCWGMLGAEKEVTILELNERIAERRKAAGLTQ